ncbi:succinate dehydrogenase, hydrophobic membrane anchor protein [Psychromonas antarctica]|jgi:succinate dehydrogenase / fumarate reductase membrane anchor subunit|uniref:succinate dehydrogenase, hydrophobic membrane anchor protein n=1 Tax=Psychromonas antarctica TaxID=67573 RepID=UPI001EE92880|nr:succinate dehydrogenase, hydrophobic membrane anchor protein [Psychromonas antarctica]MCG6201332.1 succinate dehydrogenase, hydrophobic membrane anchor protein [Psychromonas antarctica]
MVKVAGTFGRSGVHDYILLRASAVILLAYIIYLVGFISSTDITYLVWRSFFSLTLTKVFTLFALIAMLVHSWIGIWQVLTDYVKNTLLRGTLQFFLTSIAFIYVISGVVILWGI